MRRWAVRAFHVKREFGQELAMFEEQRKDQREGRGWGGSGRQESRRQVGFVVRSLEFILRAVGSSWRVSGSCWGRRRAKEKQGRDLGWTVRWL